MSIISPRSNQRSPSVARSSLPRSDAPTRGVVLIVDDTPANLAYLSDALGDAGYKVLVSIDGQTALTTLLHTTPDIILLDAMMPGIDGFEACRMIKSLSSCADVPIVFMTALVDTTNVVRAFDAGAIDYVTKPVRHEEVLARVSTHIERAKVLRKAQRSIEACGRASMTINLAGEITWKTPRVAQWLTEYCDPDSFPTQWQRLHSWMLQLAAAKNPQPGPHWQLSITHGHGRLTLHYAGRLAADELLLLLHDMREDATAQRLMDTLNLTAREAAVIQWLSTGKTDREIAEILSMAPRTVNKHLEHIYVKLGVETRAAAAAIASNVTAAPAP